ncbi:hypothetical protein JW698_02025, partial [Candidatus Wolfebacteria bacterium]|nr:hypothetical protein [Candidatus Wolfebacteria bacterium]
ANPISIISPQESTLSWNCSYANSCSIDQRIGKVDNIFGSIKVSPTSTTVYKLSCQGEDDSEEYKATVNVGFIPIIKEVAPY